MFHPIPEAVLPYKEVGGLAPNFASKNIGDRYPKFCPLNFRYNPKCCQNCFSFPIFASCSNRTPQIFLLFGELDRTLPQILPLNSMPGPSLPPPPPRPPDMEVPPLGIRAFAFRYRFIYFFHTP